MTVPLPVISFIASVACRVPISPEAVPITGVMPFCTASRYRHTRQADFPGNIAIATSQTASASYENPGIGQFFLCLRAKTIYRQLPGIPLAIAVRKHC